jgi:hypothetical protein
MSGTDNKTIQELNTTCPSRLNKLLMIFFVCLHIRNLEKLAETNVPDTKRIVKKLGGSKAEEHFLWHLELVIL